MYVVLIFSFGVITFTNYNCISVYLYLYFCCLFEREKKIEIKKTQKTLRPEVQLVFLERLRFWLGSCVKCTV